MGQEEISFTPIWLHMEYFYLLEEYQLFVQLVKIDESVIRELQNIYEKDPPEMVSWRESALCKKILYILFLVLSWV